MPLRYLSGALDLLPDVICAVDAEGHFVYVSGGCERIFGYPVGELIGRQMLELVHPEDRARTLQAVERIMAGEPQRHFENRYLRRDGGIVRVAWSASWSAREQVRIAVAREVVPDPHGGEDVRWWLAAAPPSLVPPGLSPIPLSAQDFAVLRVFIGTCEVVSRRAIVQALGENYLDYDQRRLDTQMRRLRRKVEQACGLVLPIQTLRGQGYRFYERLEQR